MLRNPDKKTLKNGNICEKHLLKFRASICQAGEVTCIYTPIATTIVKETGTCRGTTCNHPVGCGTSSRLPVSWHGAGAVAKGGIIYHLLQANLSQSIFIIKLEGRCWNTWRDQRHVGLKREVVVELCWMLHFRFWARDSPVRQPAQHQGRPARCRTEPNVAWK